MKRPDWAKSDPQFVRQIVDEAQLYLSGLLQTAISTDQRSATLAGVFISASTGIAAAFLGYVAAKGVDIKLLVAAGVAGILFAAAAIYCIQATLPVNWHLAGNSPAGWYSDVISKKPFMQALGEEAENYQRYIERNEKVMARASQRLRRGAILGMVAPFAGVAAYFIAFLF